eukprot:Hpha_TRINITY_DN17794_c0_g1::TRINITY_DN17794_c0_g1_i1::g.46398::m.46398
MRPAAPLGAGEWIQFKDDAGGAAGWCRYLPIFSSSLDGSLPDGTLPSEQGSWPAGAGPWAWGSFGGPAVFSTRRPSGPGVTVRSGSGRGLMTFQAEVEDVIGMGWWKEGERLGVVASDGTVLCLALNGAEEARWPLCAGTPLAGESLAAAGVCVGAVVGVTHSGRVCLIRQGAARGTPLDGIRLCEGTSGRVDPSSVEVH